MRDAEVHSAHIYRDSACHHSLPRALLAARCCAKHRTLLCLAAPCPFRWCAPPLLGRVFAKAAGVWAPEAWLDIPGGDAATLAEFGSSIAVERRTGTKAIISAPGTSKAYFFKRTYNNGLHTFSWTYIQSLTPSTHCIARVQPWQPVSAYL